MRRVAVLDGGFAAWRAAGLPLETTVRTPQPRSLEVRLDERAAVDSAASMSCASGPDTLLVDARGADRFAGRDETIDPVARPHPRRAQSAVHRQSRRRREDSCPPKRCAGAGRCCWVHGRQRR